MAHKKSLEALDRSMQDLRNNKNRFGGAMILLAGDFRQILPIVPRSTPADELNACLKSSILWKYIKTLKLSINMRVELQEDQSGEVFSKQLVDIGNGIIAVDTSSGYITFPTNFCNFCESKTEIMEMVFPNIAQNYVNHIWLIDRVILAAKNVDVNEINFHIQEKLAGELKNYKSVDSITNEDEVVNYPTEFLNSLELPGLPPHNLQLKTGSTTMSKHEDTIEEALDLTDVHFLD
ncbi:uncharacterized protein LOC125776145 [Bactrocera dorsalis]|uniref:ATP-dependent DNA helicase n=1 Tax=Bactrocera dorsalis TaxID=27457 RepID=A0ABM3J169_BACDO|nr:uncharacterized protein LOC125776145 [Bactrocera dorsalis]